jgi:molybdopterin converting factor subunit 1
MKRVRVLYFAAVRDLLGMSEEDLDLPAHVEEVAGFVAELERRHPELVGRLGGVRFAVNETFADAHDPVSAGDVVAVIPPVAGG